MTLTTSGVDAFGLLVNVISERFARSAVLICSTFVLPAVKVSRPRAPGEYGWATGLGPPLGSVSTVFAGHSPSWVVSWR